MSIFVPCSTQNKQDLLDLILTFTVTILSLLLNSEKIIFNADMFQIFHHYISLWILLLLALLIAASYQSWRSYTTIKGIKAWFSITSAVQLPGQVNLFHISETTRQHQYGPPHMLLDFRFTVSSNSGVALRKGNSTVDSQASSSTLSFSRLHWTVQSFFIPEIQPHLV